jgi:hypothetical protein
MTGSFLPEFKEIPVRGGYRASYRLFDSQPYRFIPGKEVFATAGQAITAAKDYVRARLNPPIRGEVTEPCDVLDVRAWHEQKAAQRAAEQEQALGAIIIKGRAVKVERTKVRA